MAQFARPDADTSAGTWTTQAGGTANLYATVDETAADDADYVKSVTAPSSAPVVFRLSDVTDPVSSSGHVIRVRARNGVTGGKAVDLTAQLRQGYVNEGTPGTLIATLTQASVSESFTTYSATLTGGEADAITDYTDLYLRVVANQP